MIKIDVKRPENANMEIWEILFFIFYSWKNAKFLVKIAKQFVLPNMINIDAKCSENANMEIWEILSFTFYSWKNAKLLVKKNIYIYIFAKYDKNRRKTSRKCKYGNVRNFIFSNFSLENTPNYW